MIDSPTTLRTRGHWAEDLALLRTRPPFGPRNTLSNLAFLAVGTYLPWRFQDEASAALGVALWVLGTGSALYHSEKTILANRLDWVGMLMVFGALAAHGWVPDSPVAPWVMLGVGGLAALYYQAQGWMSRDWWMVCLGVMGALPVLLRGQGSLLLAASLGVFGVAYGVWHLDKQRAALVGLSGHAWWHVLSAVGIGLLFAAQR